MIVKLIGRGNILVLMRPDTNTYEMCNACIRAYYVRHRSILCSVALDLLGPRGQQATCHRGILLATCYLFLSLRRSTARPAQSRCSLCLKACDVVPAHQAGSAENSEHEITMTGTHVIVDTRFCEGLAEVRPPRSRVFSARIHCADNERSSTSPALRARRRRPGCKHTVIAPTLEALGVPGTRPTDACVGAPVNLEGSGQIGHCRRCMKPSSSWRDKVGPYRNTTTTCTPESYSDKGGGGFVAPPPPGLSGRLYKCLPYLGPN